VFKGEEMGNQENFDFILDLLDCMIIPI
jgi:hypothetical protein